MNSKTRKTTGWILTGTLTLLLGFSAIMKISLSAMAVDQAATLGMDPGLYRLIGFAELLSVLLFIFPRTGVLGALLLIAYMGGAIATHLQHHQPVTMPVIVQVLIWITVVVRFPEIIQRLFPSLKTYMGNNKKITT